MKTTVPTRVCLDCTWMKHSRDDWYRGKCEYHGKEINYVNNCDSCSKYDRLAFLDHEEDDDEYPFDDAVVEIKFEGERL